MTIAIERRTDYLALAQRLAANPDDWPLAPRFDPSRRWYHRLDTVDGAEAWLLTWLPGQSTELHDHGGSSGAFVVVSGQLVEQTVDEYGIVAGRRLRAGAGRSFGARHVHRILNAGDRPAVSVHVYSPALTEMTRYRLDSGRLLATAVERAGADW
jgi:oxalate decarboxylase/phosphoglucose isomerase-like protein (cupin superfamily)